MRRRCEDVFGTRTFAKEQKLAEERKQRRREDVKRQESVRSNVWRCHAAETARRFQDSKIVYSIVCVRGTKQCETRAVHGGDEAVVNEAKDDRRQQQSDCVSQARRNETRRKRQRLEEEKRQMILEKNVSRN